MFVYVFTAFHWSIENLIDVSGYRLSVVVADDN